jgi:hypothetical protein
MACFAVNGLPPDPPRLWSRAQGICSTLPVDTITQEDADIIAMLSKGNVLQYKKNSSNITKQQRYSQIAKGQWTNRNTTWATQSTTATMPNTLSLKRVNYRTIYLDNGAPAVGPITCPTPTTPRIPNKLPINPNTQNIVPRPGITTTFVQICPVYVKPTGPPIYIIPGPSPELPKKPIDPEIVPVLPYINPPLEPTPRVIIPDGGQLICNISENICTGEVYSITPANDNCNPTSASDVPGPIMLLCYNNALPTYYPRQRRAYGSSGNTWPTQTELLSIMNTPVNDTTTKVYDDNLTKALAKLYENVGDDLKTLFTYFSIGNIGILRENLTYDVYQNLATLLIDSSYPADINYTNVLEIIQISLEGLYKSVTLATAQQAEILRLNSILSADTIEDIQSLSVTSDLNIIALIRPEIKIYIQLHGYPANGIFSAELINQIKETLEIE